MTDREALLRAILLDPEDLTARRIYADWLLDHGNMLGQEYAAFIHGQINGQPGFVQDAQWPAQSHQMWAGQSFAKLPWDSARWEWRNGFIEVLDCTTLDFLHHAGKLFQCQSFHAHSPLVSPPNSSAKSSSARFTGAVCRRSSRATSGRRQASALVRPAIPAFSARS